MSIVSDGCVAVAVLLALCRGVDPAVGLCAGSMTVLDTEKDTFLSMPDVTVTPALVWASDMKASDSVSVSRWCFGGVGGGGTRGGRLMLPPMPSWSESDESSSRSSVARLDFRFTAGASVPIGATEDDGFAGPGTAVLDALDAVDTAARDPTTHAPSSP